MNRDIDNWDNMTSQLKKTTMVSTNKIHCILFLQNVPRQFINILCNTFNYLTRCDNGDVFSRLLVCILFLCVHPWPRAGFVAAAPRHKAAHQQNIYSTNTRGASNYSRARRAGTLNQHIQPFHFINIEAGMFLEIRNDGTVKGTRNKNSKYIDMRVTSVDTGVVVIQGIYSKRYLAMRKKGKIQAMKNMRDECRLLERMTPGPPGFTYHWEKGRKTWYLTMDHKGRMQRSSSVTINALFAKKNAVLKSGIKKSRRRKGRRKKKRKRMKG